jgi:hypothetical protein
MSGKLVIVGSADRECDMLGKAMSEEEGGVEVD